MSQHPFKCIACEHNSGAQLLTNCRDYYLGTPYSVDYWKCEQCSLVQQSPLPQDTSAFYLSYPIHAKKSRWFNALRRMLMGGAYYPAKREERSRRLLDFGCGDGWFLESCKTKNMQLMGFERDPAHAKYLTESLGIPVESDISKLLTEQAGCIDVLTMNFVVEHLTNLHQAFANANTLLKPGGWFYFSVPNFNSVESRLFGRKWHGLDAPRHISFPDDPVVRRLAQMHELELQYARRLPFPPGIAGSLPVVLSGKFRYPLFLMFLPLALFSNFLWPDSARGYWLQKGS